MCGALVRVTIGKGCCRAERELFSTLERKSNPKAVPRWLRMAMKGVWAPPTRSQRRQTVTKTLCQILPQVSGEAYLAHKPTKTATKKAFRSTGGFRRAVKGLLDTHNNGSMQGTGNLLEVKEERREGEGKRKRGSRQCTNDS